MKVEKGDHSRVLLPETKSPIQRMAPVILSGWTLLSAIYFLNYEYWKDSRSILNFLPPPAEEYCGHPHSGSDDNNDASDSSLKVCSRSDLFAFQVSSCLAILVCGCYGFYSWHFSSSSFGKEQAAISASTPEVRIFHRFQASEFLCAVNFTFQSWDFVISLLIPEHRTAVMLSHHIMASMVSLSGLVFSYLHYYAVFFLGLSEVSSIFLVFVDLSRYFPPERNSWYDTVIQKLLAPLFVVSFVVYRVILWWPISLQLFRDCGRVWKKTQNLQPPGKRWVLVLFLGCNLPLGILQLYWLSIILEEVTKVLTSGGAGNSEL